MMHKWMGKIAAAGISVCLFMSVLAGCSGTSEKEETESQTQEGTAENQATEAQNTEERPEVQEAEHPQFIPDGLRKVVLVREGEEIFHLSKEPADYKMDFDYWEILNPYDETVTVNTEQMYNLFEALCDFDFQTPVAVPQGVDTGIENASDRMLLEFADTLDAETAKKAVYADAAAEILIGNEDGQGNRYAAVKGKEDQVYKLSKDTLEAIYGLDPFDYILKIPVLVNITTVENLEITMDNKTYNMQVDAASGSYQFNKKKVEKEEFTDLYQALAAVALQSEIKEEPKEEKEALLTVVYHRNMENAPEITVEYDSYDEEFCSVSVNGKDRFLVKAEDIETLMKQIKKAF